MAATVGERLRALRSERGLTQEQLAGLASVSVDLVKKLEQGRRESARLTSLAALADALDVPLSELTDKRPRLDGAGDRLVLGLRDVLLTPDLLPGMEPEDDGEPAQPEAIREMTSAGWRDYWSGRFVEVARRVPGLVGEAHAAMRHDGDAVDTLLRAKTLAPVWFRHQVAARNLVTEVCERRARLTPAMRELVRSLDAH